MLLAALIFLMNHFISTAFEIEVFCKNVKVSTVTYDHSNPKPLSKSLKSQFVTLCSNHKAFF